MTWTDYEADMYIITSKETDYKPVCYVKDTPPDILKRIRKFNADYKAFYNRDFVHFIDDHGPDLQEDEPDPDTLPEGDY